MNKEKLDGMLKTYKVQPVRHGYIDIIVNRENYKGFIDDLISNGFKIESVSWWEWCPGDKENEYGLRGPKSLYYDGWSSELSVPVDDIDLANGNKREIEKIINLIETKSILFPSEKVTFKQSDWLTPAIWLNVPNEWRNEYCAKQSL